MSAASRLVLALALPSVLALRAGAQCALETQDLAPADGQAGDSFGYRVERDGDVAVVAATFDDDLGLDAGSAYVLARDPAGHWDIAKKLLASDGAAGDFFAYSVAVDGARVLVGAPGHDGAASHTGAVYVFARDQGGANQWGEVARFTPPGLAPGAGFAYSIARHGDRLLVGAPHHATGLAGRAFLYRRDASSASGWTLERDFTSSAPATALEFGQDVALGEAVLAVSGSTTSVQPYSDSYVVHVRERDAGGPGNWGEVQRLFSPTGARDIFAYEIALDEDELVAVAPAETDLQSGQIGALYLYRRDLGGPSAWGLARRLAEFQPDGFFAVDEVDLAGDWIVAGSFGLTAGGQPSAGALFVYGRDVGGPEAWGSLGRIESVPPEAEAFFGLDLTLAGDELLVGAPGTYSGSESGELYALDLGRLARASWRNDAAGLDPDVYRVLSRPWLGTRLVAEVDLAASGHAFAWLTAFARAAEVPLAGGRVLLGAGTLAHASAAGPLAHFEIALPADASLCGRALVTQAALVGAGRPFALSNAQDLVLGFP